MSRSAFCIEKIAIWRLISRNIVIYHYRLAISVSSSNRLQWGVCLGWTGNFWEEYVTWFVTILAVSFFLSPAKCLKAYIFAPDRQNGLCQWRDKIKTCLISRFWPGVGETSCNTVREGLNKVAKSAHFRRYCRLACELPINAITILQPPRTCN